MKDMICTNCNRTVRYRDWYFCPYCGKNLCKAFTLQDDVEKLDLPLRAWRALHENEVKTVQDLIKLDVMELSKMRGMGIRTATKTAGVLKLYGIELKPLTGDLRG